MQLALSVGRNAGPSSSLPKNAVLEARLRVAPATLSTEDLLEQAWDDHTDAFTKTVQVTIGPLRRKLGAPDAIETIPDVGYRIIEQDAHRS